MNFIKFIFFAIPCFLFAGCIKETEVETGFVSPADSHGATSKKLFPLQKHNVWLYKLTQYGTDNTTTFMSTYTQEVMRTININGNDYYKLSVSDYYYSSPNDSITLIANYNGQVTTCFRYNDMPSKKILKIGTMDEYEYNTNFHAQYGTVQYNGVSCILFTIQTIPRNKTEKTILVEQYVKPGIGIIAQVTKELTNGNWDDYRITEKRELEDYYLYP